MLDINIGDGASPLDVNQLYWARLGYGVVDADTTSCEVTVNTGNLDAADTLSVAAGTVEDGGTEISVSAQNLRIDSAGSLPRKDTVWVDNTGTAQVEKGTPRERLPSDKDRFETFNPASPIPSTEPAAVLATVYVPSGSSTIAAGDVRDRRVGAEGAGGGSYTVVSKTANYTATAGEIVLVDASGGAVTVTLPGPNPDDLVTVKKTDGSANAVTVATPGAETIDGQSSLSISAQYESNEITSDGSNYFVV